MDKSQERHQRGLEVRRKMFAQRDNRPRPPWPIQKLRPEFTEYLTECVFGEVMPRPGLVVLGRQEERRLHLRAALNNGLTKDEITEAIFHAKYGHWVNVRPRGVWICR